MPTCFSSEELACSSACLFRASTNLQYKKRSIKSALVNPNCVPISHHAGFDYSPLTGKAVPRYCIQAVGGENEQANLGSRCDRKLTAGEGSTPNSAGSAGMLERASRPGSDP